MNNTRRILMALMILVCADLVARAGEQTAAKPGDAGPSVSQVVAAMDRADSVQDCGAMLSQLLFCQTVFAVDVQITANEIREEALRSSSDSSGHPLPLACSWTCGHFPKDSSVGWRPENQMRMIADGHHLLPWFAHPEGELPADPAAFRIKYYKAAIERARGLGLPITFVASQWESGLSSNPYLDLPATENPNVVTPEGEVLAKVSPFGPVAPWREIGRKHTDNPWMKQLQQWYSDPPLVIFLSNNEHSKLSWTEAETDRRYVEQYGKDCDDDFKRKVMADGWIERYRALQAGMRQGLENVTWRKNSIYIGYEAFGPTHLGRWGGWPAYSQHSEGRIDPSPMMWDGGSPSYYTDDWQPRRDYTVWSPQVEFMNLVFMQHEALRANPRFWFEFSVWDGYHNDPERQQRYPSTRSVYRKAGQTYTPERYAGFVQFGMWLTRPRAVRDFRGWTEPWDDVVGSDGKVTYEGGGPYFMAIAKAVDRVYASPVLRQWWRKGELVPNRAHPHPYQAGIPAAYQQADRWFLLDTTLDPARPWSLATPLPVFSLALVQGTAPTRQWLIYAHAPLGDRKAVGVTIPQYKSIVIDVPVAGAFFRIDEAKGTAEEVQR